VEAEFSLPFSQEPTDCPCPEPCKHIPHTLVLFLYTPFNITRYLSSVFTLVFCLRVFQSKFYKYFFSLQLVLHNVPIFIKIWTIFLLLLFGDKCVKNFALIAYVSLIISKIVYHRILQRTSVICKWMFTQCKIGALKMN
jgi:hypothetical protein